MPESTKNIDNILKNWYHLFILTSERELDMNKKYIDLLFIILGIPLIISIIWNYYSYGMSILGINAWFSNYGSYIGSVLSVYIVASTFFYQIDKNYKEKLIKDKKENATKRITNISEMNNIISDMELDLDNLVKSIIKSYYCLLNINTEYKPYSFYPTNIEQNILRNIPTRIDELNDIFSKLYEELSEMESKKYIFVDKKIFYESFDDIEKKVFGEDVNEILDNLYRLFCEIMKYKNIFYCTWDKTESYVLISMFEHFEFEIKYEFKKLKIYNNEINKYLYSIDVNMTHNDNEDITKRIERIKEEINNIKEEKERYCKNYKNINKTGLVNYKRS